MKPLKIGILGGTFHPIHNGHIQMAKTACSQFQLDQMIFLPTGHSPHKEFSGETMSKHRMEMVRLAIEGEALFSLSGYEIDAQTVSYTYQTLQHFRSLYPDAELFFLIGADSLFDFALWKHPEQICREATLLVAVRDQWNSAHVADQIDKITQTYGGTFYQIQMPAMPISSHEIRSLAANNQSISAYVPTAVEAYIIKNKLYTEDSL